MTIHRNIREEPSFIVAVKRLTGGDVRRFDRLRENFDWSLSLRAEFFPSVPDTPLRILKTRAGAGGFPALNVFFSIPNPDQVALWDVRVAADQTECGILAPLPHAGSGDAGSED